MVKIFYQNQCQVVVELCFIVVGGEYECVEDKLYGGVVEVVYCLFKGGVSYFEVWCGYLIWVEQQLLVVQGNNYYVGDIDNGVGQWFKN